MYLCMNLLSRINPSQELISKKREIGIVIEFITITLVTNVR